MYQVCFDTSHRQTMAVERLRAVLAKMRWDSVKKHAALMLQLANSTYSTPAKSWYLNDQVPYRIAWRGSRERPSRDQGGCSGR